MTKLAFNVGTEAREDISAIHAVVAAAFNQNDEADLVDRLRDDGDLVLSLVARSGDKIIGHIGFSRLFVETATGEFVAVALAPVSVLPDWQKKGVGSALINAGHARLIETGEQLSIVLGEPAYYGKFGYSADRAGQFDCDWSGPYLQALSWSDEAPSRGRLRYASAFLS